MKNKCNKKPATTDCDMIDAFRKSIYDQATQVDPWGYPLKWSVAFQENVTEDAEFEIIEPKQLTDGTEKTLHSKLQQSTPQASSDSDLVGNINTENI